MHRQGSSYRVPRCSTTQAPTTHLLTVAYNTYKVDQETFPETSLKDALALAVRLQFRSAMAGKRALEKFLLTEDDVTGLLEEARTTSHSSASPLSPPSIRRSGEGGEEVHPSDTASIRASRESSAGLGGVSSRTFAAAYELLVEKFDESITDTVDIGDWEESLQKPDGEEDSTPNHSQS